MTFIIHMIDNFGKKQVFTNTFLMVDAMYIRSQIAVKKNVSH